MNLIHEIRRRRDDYVRDTGREPSKIKMSYPTFLRIREYAIENGFLWSSFDYFLYTTRRRLYGMELELVDNMEGVEVYDV